MPILSFLFSILFFVPLTSAFFACSLGRSFWKWFAIGCVLPLVSVFILWFLPEIKEKKAFAW
ncbi:MAG: hypothetical protein M3R17_03325 [Bacteroidota bacterium]|nr:hypothetical protein [Bacteroidota bacterium]